MELSFDFRREREVGEQRQLRERETFEKRFSVSNVSYLICAEKKTFFNVCFKIDSFIKSVFER